MGIIEDSLVLQRSERVDRAARTVYLTVEASGAAATLIDVDQVRGAIGGKGLRAATEWLSAQFPLREQPQIAVTPPWWEHIPLLPARTEIIVSSGAS